MGVKVDMDIREIRDYLQREAEKNIHRVISMLHYVGLEVVNQIRNSQISNWNDQTGNLRSSIGYIITLDGEPIEMSDFPKVDGWKRQTTDPDGSAIGRTYARSLTSLYPHGIALIVVAGMEYAAYVEKMENKTVLAQGELVARQLLSQLLQKYNIAKGQ